MINLLKRLYDKIMYHDVWYEHYRTIYGVARMVSPLTAEYQCKNEPKCAKLTETKVETFNDGKPRVVIDVFKRREKRWFK